MIRLKIFRVIQRHFTILGIHPTNQSNQKNPTNKRIVVGFLLFACFIPSQYVYFFYVASDFMEYMECFCSMSASMIIFINLLAIVFKKTLLFENIEKIEKLIETSELFHKLILFTILKINNLN